MSPAIYGVFFFTVVLLVTTAYFLLGGIPLLVLRHDVPLDAKFIRGFFNLYYRSVFWAAVGVAVSFAFWGRPAFAVGAVSISVTATLLRTYLLPALQLRGAQIEAAHDGAVQRFRRLHALALLVNLAQLVGVVWALIHLSKSMAGIA